MYSKRTNNLINMTMCRTHFAYELSVINIPLCILTPVFDCIGAKVYIVYRLSISLQHCRYVFLQASSCCYIFLQASSCCYIFLQASSCCYIFLQASSCCYIFLQASSCCYIFLQASSCRYVFLQASSWARHLLLI